MSQFACPECGAELHVDALKNGTFTSYCSAEHCRAGDWITHGKTPDQATDKFVRKCEQYGYVTALSGKLDALVRRCADKQAITTTAADCAAGGCYR